MILYFESVVAPERKTNVLLELERRGFRRVAEVARQIIQSRC
jgi:predicted ATPase